MGKRGIVLLAERRAKQWINSSHKQNATDVAEAWNKGEQCQCLIQSASVWHAKKRSAPTHDTKRPWKKSEKKS